MPSVRQYFCVWLLAFNKGRVHNPPGKRLQVSTPLSFIRAWANETISIVCKRARFNCKTSHRRGNFSSHKHIISIQAQAGPRTTAAGSIGIWTRYDAKSGAIFALLLRMNSWNLNNNQVSSKTQQMATHPDEWLSSVLPWIVIDDLGIRNR